MFNNRLNLNSNESQQPRHDPRTAIKSKVPDDILNTDGNFDADNPAKLERFLNANWYFNINQNLSLKLQKLICGRGILFHHPNDKLLKDINKWAKTIRLHEILKNACHTWATQGVLNYFIYKTESNLILIDFAKFSLLGSAAKINEQEQAIDIITYSGQSSNGNMLHIKGKNNKIKITNYSNDNLSLNGREVSVPKEWKKRQVSTFKSKFAKNIFPFGQIMYRNVKHPVLNSPNLTAFPIITSVWRLQIYMEQVWIASQRELIINRTQLHGAFNEEDLQDLRNSENPEERLLAASMFQNTDNSYANGKLANGVTIMQGDPQVLNYLDMHKAIYDIVLEAVGLTPTSQKSTNTYENSNTSVVKNKNDSEFKLANQALFGQVVDKLTTIWLMDNGYSENEIDEFSWNWIDLDILDTSTKLEDMQKQKELGIFNPIKGIMSLNNVTRQEAEKEYKEITKYAKEQLELTTNNDEKLNNNKNTKILKTKGDN